MRTSSPIARAAIWLAVAGWLGSAGCAGSSIDADRSAFVSPSGVAARAAARAQLSLAEDKAHHELTRPSGAALQRRPSRGPLLEAYQRWLTDKMRGLSPGASTDAGK